TVVADVVTGGLLSFCSARSFMLCTRFECRFLWQICLAYGYTLQIPKPVSTQLVVGSLFLGNDLEGFRLLGCVGRDVHDHHLGTIRAHLDMVIPLSPFKERAAVHVDRFDIR